MLLPAIASEEEAETVEEEEDEEEEDEGVEAAATAAVALELFDVASTPADADNVEADVTGTANVVRFIAASISFPILLNKLDQRYGASVTAKIFRVSGRLVGRCVASAN